MVIKSNMTKKDILFIVAAAGFCVLCAGGFDDSVVKPLVARWRPTHDPQIGMLIDTVDNYRGGNYGFFSAHASNTFSIALFLAMSSFMAFSAASARAFSLATPRLSDTLMICLNVRGSTWRRVIPSVSNNSLTN